MRFLNTLQDEQALADLTAPEAAGVKYLAPRAGAPRLPPLTEPCYFQNMRKFSWHLQFLNSFPELADLPYDLYTRIVLGASSRRLWGGAVTPWPRVTHPGTGAKGIIAYNIYGDSGSVTADDIIAVDTRLKGCIPFAHDRLVYVPDTVDQRAILTAARSDLARTGVASLFPEDLVDDLTPVAYSLGEGYGTLRVVAQGQALTDYGPHDVIVVESAPNDISIVAGLISKNPQNQLGHVNLRLRERDTPNVSVPGIYQDSRVTMLGGKLVHLVVSRDQFVLESATLEDAQAFWDAHRPHISQPVADLSVVDAVPLVRLRATDRAAFGSKTANLGELSLVLEDRNRANGFGIPFSWYVSFMQGAGLADRVTGLLADARMYTDLTYKRAQLKSLRDAIKSAVFPDAQMISVQQQIAAVFGSGGPAMRLHFRSSSNVEDLDAFTGAGLYDSKSGCLLDDGDGDTLGPSACLSDDERAALQVTLAQRQAEWAQHPERAWLAGIIDDLSGDLADEKPVATAIKKVWASLWNERAFDQRTFYGIDQQRAYMAVTVNPTFVGERASAVAVTNLEVSAGGPLYRLNSQVGSESVVEPEDPTAVAELLSFRRAGDPPEPVDIQVQLSSNRLPSGTPVWPAEKLAEVAHLLFRVHDHFATQVYPDLTPFSLDCELKFTADGQVVFKQARPFISKLP